MWQIITCSLIDQLITAVRKFQRFSDLSFISAFEPILVLKLDYTLKLNFPNTQKTTIAINFSLQSAQQFHYVF